MAKNLARITPRSVSKVDEEAATNRALLEFQSPTLALVSKPVPPFSHYATYMMFSMLVAFLIVAGTFPIDRVVTASGKVSSQSSNLLVQPLEASIVRSIDVKLGQHVHTGDLLARLDPTFTAADAASLKAQTLSLTAEVRRLTAEQNGTNYSTDGTPDSNLQAGIFAQRKAERGFKVETYNQKISSLDTLMRKAQSEILIYTQRVGYAESLLKARETLEQQGVGSRLNTIQARDSLAEAQRALAGAQAAAMGGKRDMDAAIAERDGYIQQAKGETSQQLTEAGRKLADASEQLAKAEKRRDLVEIRAGKDAVVLAIANVSVGSVLQSAEPFLTLVPDDAVMQIDGAIPATDVGFVRVGDPVVVKFDAYKFQEHGYAEGTVITVAPDAQANPTEGPDKPKIDNVPVNLGQSIYRVKISIDALKLTNLPPDFRLQPGLGVEADVKVGKRTMLSYLLGRFIPALTEGMREP